MIDTLTKVLCALALAATALPALAGNPKVLMETSQGNITLELDAEHAPVTVANFLRYVDEGFYSGTVFHRVIDNFMIQGGGMDAGLRQKETHAPIVNEADNPELDIHDIPAFFTHLLERIQWERDLHFQTETTIDTLDYSGSGLNRGSKLVVAAIGPVTAAAATELGIKTSVISDTFTIEGLVEALVKHFG